MAHGRFKANPEQTESFATTHLRKIIKANPEQTVPFATTHLRKINELEHFR